MRSLDISRLFIVRCFDAMIPAGTGFDFPYLKIKCPFLAHTGLFHPKTLSSVIIRLYFAFESSVSVGLLAMFAQHIYGLGLTFIKRLDYISPAKLLWIKAIIAKATSKHG
ncbi:hypothetical protein ACMWRF_003958 [Enterobacter hormaechei]|uniref:hypothetical protein n=1 Tax=Enterobacter hormaechei TaxID=158836 RepID=UPI001E439F1E|nr:hypothetical protein [Enterobacter hormaechei]EKW3905728.1 hypothetical protein [Enterobacter hormaechei]MCB4925141.1 hypothetical protein [Enterobacter hormaechei]